MVDEKGTRVEQVVGGREWKIGWTWKRDGKKLSGSGQEKTVAAKRVGALVLP